VTAGVVRCQSGLNCRPSRELGTLGVIATLYEQVMDSLAAIEQDTDSPPTGAKILKIAHIEALCAIGQASAATQT
jgi:hypothetical protein